MTLLLHLVSHKQMGSKSARQLEEAANGRDR